MPAFPTEQILKEHDEQRLQYEYVPQKYSGLSKRELFAAMCMQALVGNVNCIESISDWMGDHPGETSVSVAVKCADALIAELEKPNGCD